MIPPFSRLFRAALPFAALLLGFPLSERRAAADFYIEPYTGYSLALVNPKAAPQPAEGSLKTVRNAAGYLLDSRYYAGPMLGVRAGYKSLGLALGADAAAGMWGGLGSERGMTPFLAGLFVSYRLPLLFRVYAALMPGVFVPGLSFARISGPGTEERAVSCQIMGGKIGLSYFSLPFLSLNLEYMPLYIKGRSCGALSHTATAYLSFPF